MHYYVIKGRLKGGDGPADLISKFHDDVKKLFTSRIEFPIPHTLLNKLHKLGIDAEAVAAVKRNYEGHAF